MLSQKLLSQSADWFNPLSANYTELWNTLKQFVSNSRRFAWEYSAILWGWRLKCLEIPWNTFDQFVQV